MSLLKIHAIGAARCTPLGAKHLAIIPTYPGSCSVAAPSWSSHLHVRGRRANGAVMSHAEAEGGGPEGGPGAAAGPAFNAASSSASLGKASGSGRTLVPMEVIRRYIPAEAMVVWATVKQLLDALFDGAMNTQLEVNTFAIVWAVFVVGVGVWVHWSLRQKTFDAVDDNAVTAADAIKHSLLSAAAFALYTLSFGSHSVLLKQTLLVPERVIKAGEGVLMLAFPLATKLLGDSRIKGR